MKQFRAVIEYPDEQVFYHYQGARSKKEAIEFINAKFYYTEIKIIEIKELEPVVKENNTSLETYYGGRNEND